MIVVLTCIATVHPALSAMPLSSKSRAANPSAVVQESTSPIVCFLNKKYNIHQSNHLVKFYNKLFFFQNFDHMLKN